MSVGRPGGPTTALNGPANRARLRYTKTRGEWSLYWTDRNSKFHVYDRVEPTPTVDRLLAEIDADPTCIFWG